MSTQIAKSKGGNIKISNAINSTLIALLTLAFFAQLIIGKLNSQTLTCALIIYLISILMFLYLRYTKALENYPLSSFAIFGFGATNVFGALLVQSATWVPVDMGLRQPVTTFATLALYQLIAIVAHAIYRTIGEKRKKSEGFIRKIFKKSGLYLIPAPGSLWMIGAVGAVAVLLASSTGGGERGLNNKVSAGFIFLSWAPFLIPIYSSYFGKAYCDIKKHLAFLALYAGLFVLIAIAVNARVFMFTGFATVLLLLFLIGMQSSRKVGFSQVAKVLGVLVLFSVLIPPLSDLATAMVIARDFRDKAAATPSRMVEETITALENPQVIRAYRAKEQKDFNHSSYDEYYIENPIGQRFVETKFHDNALYFSSRLSQASKDELKTMTTKLIIAILPQPILDKLGVKLKKDDYVFSMGDYLLYLNTGDKLGGFKTGSVFAHGQGLFGYSFGFFYFFICILFFYILDLFTFKGGNAVLLSVPAMNNIFKIFQYGIAGESLIQMATFGTRGYIQILVIYLAVFSVTKLFFKSYDVAALLKQKAENDLQQEVLVDDTPGTPHKTAVYYL